jgi:hypothetical protein
MEGPEGAMPLLGLLKLAFLLGGSRKQQVLQRRSNSTDSLQRIIFSYCALLR